MDEHIVSVLLVDDDEDDYIITLDWLSDIEGTEFRLDWVGTYDDAHEAIERNQHDVCLLDYRLGSHCGLELLREAIANDCKVPIIMLTGQGDHAVDIEAMNAGAADYLVKNQINAPLLERSIRYAIERKQIERRLVQLAQYDSLTGLANRALFQDRLPQALARADRGGQLVGLMFLDLDRFKKINDTLGHDVGDMLLKSVAERLEGRLRRTDTIARLGGDEFTIILEGFQQVGEIATVAQEILEVMAAPFNLKVHETFVSTSIGIAIYPNDGDDVDTLMKNADAAMYRAKEQGRNTYQFYTEDLNAKSVERLALESDLRRALEREEFELYYQPQVDLQTGGVTGMEALIRWRRSDTSELVSPAEFIPLAEETGLIVPIGEWVLRTASAQNQAWQDVGLPPLRVSVNLSARQFRQDDLADCLSRILKDTRLDPQYLELELTEGHLIEPAHAGATLTRLKGMGHPISVDDFGTGYSSLSYLKRFPIDTLKIDRSFVMDITTDPDDAAIANAIIALAQSLRLKVIAEGVETEDQLDFLRSKGCHAVQGYLFSPPVPAEAVTLKMQNGWGSQP